MVRKIVSTLSVIILLIGILTGCSKKTNEYTDVIPADVATLFSLDLKSLFSKTGVTSDEVTQMKQEFIAAISSGMSMHSMEQIQKILTDPKESGIDFEKPIYLFFNKEMSVTALVNKVSDETKLKSTLDIMKDEKMFTVIEKGKNYEYIVINNNVIIAFNTHSLMILALQSPNQLSAAKNKVSEWMNQSRENSIESNGAFKKMTEKRGDIHFLSTATSMTTLYGQHLKKDLGFEDIDFNDLYIYGAVQFEQGKIGSDFAYYSDNAKINELISTQEAVSTILKNSFVKYFPKNTLAYLTTGIDGDNLYKLISSSKGYDSDFTPAQEECLNKTLTAIDGDVSIGITGLESNNMPEVKMYAAVDNDDFLQLLYTNQSSFAKHGISINQIADGIYQCVQSDFSFYYGVKNNILFMSTTPVTDDIFKDFTPDISTASFGAEMKDKKCFFVLNVEQVLDLPILKLLASLGGKQYQIYYEMANKIDYIDFVNDKNNVSHLNIVMKNNNTNSLAQIVEYAKLFLAFL